MFQLRLLICLLLSISILPAWGANSSSPLSWKGYAFGECVSNLHGGIKNGSMADAAGRLTALYDTEKANWWKGGQIALGVLGIAQTQNQSLYTGAIQTPSPYTLFNEIRITDLAYQQTFTDTFMLRAGIMDFDDYFNIMEVSVNLLNAAFINTESMNFDILLATYPYPGFGALAKIGTPKLGLLLGVFQGNPQHQRTVFQEGQQIIAELSSHFGAATAVQYTVKVGLWDYQQNLSYVGTTDHGVYLIGEATWQTKSGHPLGAGFDLGINPKKPGIVSDSIAACFTIGGVIPSREKDVLNLGFGKVWIQGTPHEETIFEVAYKIQVTDSFSISPDIQYILHPSGVHPNAWVTVLQVLYTIPT